MKIYLQPAFLICALVLAIAGGGMSIAVESFGLHFKKEPLPLKKSMEFLDQYNLSPFKVVQKIKIENPDIVKSLGTEDYIQWILEDTEATANSAVSKFMLFITYYKLPDRVPHVPEECYSGGGFQRIATDSMTLEINKAGLGQIDTRRLIFSKTGLDQWGRSQQFPVLYLFRVNGIYANSREGARIALNKNIFRKSSYFCKIELVFNRSSVLPSDEEVVIASQKLLGIILPILEAEYWPDWGKVNPDGSVK